MRIITRFGCVVVVSAALVGCNSSVSGQMMGTLGGAVAGAAIGSQIGRGGGGIVATLAGAVIGAIVGGMIGRGLDEEERRRANAAAHAALNRPVGTTSNWSSRRTGNRGSMRVAKTVAPDAKGRLCKVLTHKIAWKGGKTSEQAVKYCQNPDGSWETAA